MDRPTPGLLYVPLQQASLSDEELNNWYNNQHAPARMHFPFFLSGRRYKQFSTSDVPVSNKLALYEISDMSQLQNAPYNTLLDPQIQGKRDRDSIAKITASRQYFDLVTTYSAMEEQNVELPCQNDRSFPEGVLIVVHVKLIQSVLAEAEFRRWYEEDHLPPLRKVPGWKTTRIYCTSTIESRAGESIELITLNEFADATQIGGPQHQIAIAAESKTTAVASKRRESWTLEFTLGGGPKDLVSLARLSSEDAEYVSPDGLIRTTNDTWPVIESYVPTHTFGLVEYRLEGRGNLQSPIVGLGTLGGLQSDVWDPLVVSIMARKIHCRILRVRLNVASQPKNLPITSGAAFLELDTCISDVTREMGLPPAALTLLLGMAGKTVEKRLTGCLLDDGCEFGLPQVAEHTTPALKLTIATRNRVAMKVAMSRLGSSLRKSATVPEWAQNISQQIR